MLGAVVVTVVVAGCGITERGGTANAPGTTEATTTEATTTTSIPAEAADLSNQELASRFGDAVYRVEVVGCGVEGTGSAFAIDDTHLVTNRHVIDVDVQPTLVARDGRRLEGRVIGWGEDRDIAVIATDGGLGTALEWAPTGELSEGQPLVALGYPAPATDFTVTSGSILSFQSSGDLREAIRTDGAIDKGNSGGPALTADGRVAGVVTEMAFNEGGFQLVPLLFTADAVAGNVERIVAEPGAPQRNCTSAGSANPIPDDWDYEPAPRVGEPVSYGDDADLDELWDLCEVGDWAACDDLYRTSPYGSDYEHFGDTCGLRNEPSQYCVLLYGTDPGEGSTEPSDDGDAVPVIEPGISIVDGWYAVIRSDHTGAITVAELTEDAAVHGAGGHVVDTDHYRNGDGRPPDRYPSADVLAATVGPFADEGAVDEWCATTRPNQGCNTRQFVPTFDS
jgi:hypothetical protein